MENKKKHSAKAAQNARENKIKARNQKIVQHRIAILRLSSLADGLIRYRIKVLLRSQMTAR